MASVCILEFKRAFTGIDEFVNNIDTYFNNYNFVRINDIPLIYFSEKAGTLQLNKVLRLIKSHPDYRKFVKKCYNAVLRVA